MPAGHVAAGRGPADGAPRHDAAPVVRHVACRPEDTATELGAVRRLLGLGRGERFDEEAATAAVTGVAPTPLVLVVLDAHWCDEGTLRWLDRLLRRPTPSPVTVVVTTSHTALATARATFHELLSRDHVTVTTVAGLLTVDAAAAAGHADAGPAQAPGGVPVTEELLRHEPHLLPVARAAAVLRSADPDLVGALTGLPARRAARTLATARAIGLVPDPLPPPDRPHALDALLTTLPAPERERLNEQAAEILNDAARPATQVADLLLAQSTLPRPWMVSLLKEAAADARHTSPADAVRYLTRLRRIEPDDVATRFDLAEALLDIDPLAARDHLRWVLLRTDDPARAAATAVPLRLTALMTHEAPDAPDALDVVVRELGPGVDDARAERSPARPTGHVDRQLALAARALRAALVGTDMTRAVEDATQLLAGRPLPCGWPAVAAARVLAMADENAAAVDHLTRVVAHSQRRGEAWAECHARAAHAWLLLQAGEVTESAAQARAAARVAHGHGWEARAPMPMLLLSLAFLSWGDLDGAERVLHQVAEQRLGEAVWERHLLLTAKALVARERGRREAACALLAEAGAHLTAAGVTNPAYSAWWALSTELLLSLGRHDEAAERAAWAREATERWPTERGLGLSALASGLVANGAERVELLRESVRLLTNSSDRVYHLIAELRLGLALLELGDKKAARVHLHTVRKLATQQGLMVIARKARALLATAGGRVPAQGVGTHDSLTAAERPVAELAANGATNRDIADALFLSVRTVEYHLTSVYRKLGATGRADLAERLRRSSGQERARRTGGATW